MKRRSSREDVKKRKKEMKYWGRKKNLNLSGAISLGLLRVLISA